MKTKHDEDYLYWTLFTFKHVFAVESVNDSRHDSNSVAKCVSAF